MSLDAERYSRLERLFAQALGVEPGERAAWVEGVCGSDAELRAELEELIRLDARQEAGPFAEARVEESRRQLDAIAALDSPGWMPERVGPYRVLSQIGAGGMGQVYLAEQERPRRNVALKVMHPMLASPERERRFQRESELLGRLRHPGIAQVYQAGTFDAGHGTQPYFAMELVEGVDLCAWAAGERLTSRARLELLAEVCDAVQHAHERGVVHRDLKPDNVLVTADGRPKVLDFGVARASETAERFTTMMTRTGELVGTLEYMAPEQLAADGAAVAPCTDVYALGVIGFELLTGRRPYQIGGLPLSAAVRVISEREAPRLGALEPQASGDVETILGKALAKESARRYASAAALAADLRRFLAHEPIAARPPSRRYRVKRFVQRHRGLSLGAAATFVTLVAGVAVSSAFWLESARQLEVSRRQTYRAALVAAVASRDAPSSAPMAQHLAAAPESLRGWEWRHLSLEASGSAFRETGSTSLFSQSIATAHVSDLLAGVRNEGDRGCFIVVRAGASGELLWEQPLDVVDSAALGFSPRDTELRALVCDRERARVEVLRFDARSGAPLGRRFLGGAFLDVVFDDEGRTAAFSDGSSLRVLELERGEELARFEVEDGVRVRFGDGGRLLGYVGGERSARGLCVVEVASGVRVLETESANFALAPDRPLVAIARPNATVELVDLRAPETVLLSIAHGGAISSLAFLPAGGPLVALQQDGSLEVWDLDTGLPVGLPRLHVGAGRLGLLPAADAIVTCCPGPLRVWPLTPGRPGQTVLAAHASFVYAVAFSPDGRRLATGGWDGEAGAPGALRVWGVDGRRERWRRGVAGETVMAVDWLGDDLLVGVVRRLKTGAIGKEAAILRLAPDGRERWRFLELGAAPECVSVDVTGARVAVTTEGDLLLLDASTGVLLARADLRLSRDHAEWIYDYELAWSPDGRALAVNRPGGGLELRAADDLRVLRRFELPGQQVHQLEFSPDGRLLASAWASGVVQVTDVESGAPACAPLPHGQGVLCLAFSPDGSRLATGARDKLVRLFETRRFEELVALSGHEAYVARLAWSPDGETLASASGDTSVLLWETRSATSFAPLAGAEAQDPLPLVAE